MIKLECPLSRNIKNCKLSTTRTVVFDGQKDEVKFREIYSEIKNCNNRVKLGMKGD